jgi:hypothetical protein
LKWTVVWLKNVEQEFAEAWLNSKDRSTVSQAANQIDSILRTSPEISGDPYRINQRVLQVGSLAVTYFVDEPNRIVSITGLLDYQQFE